MLTVWEQTVGALTSSIWLSHCWLYCQSESLGSGPHISLNGRLAECGSVWQLTHPFHWRPAITCDFGSAYSRSVDINSQFCLSLRSNSQLILCISSVHPFPHHLLTFRSNTERTHFYFSYYWQLLKANISMTQLLRPYITSTRLVESYAVHFQSWYALVVS